MKRYLLNISSGTIHNGLKPCYQGRLTAEFNKKWFDDYLEAVNYFEGRGKKGCPCGNCLKEKENE